MKSISLLLLRVGLGLLILIWAMVKLGAPEAAIGVSDKYYGGMLSGETLILVLGIAQALLGLLVILGLFRALAFPAMVIVLGLGAAAVWPSLIDPLGLIFGEDNVQILFFPSLIVFFGTLVMFAFRDQDTLSLDAIRGR
ncbi:hypothetical protein [Pyruvatibacter sp.]|uniref:hypothetical protein n=1 Tax=Pyruvatibacter sp. TaxID=1981328 RepID=UPI00326517C6